MAVSPAAVPIAACVPSCVIACITLCIDGLSIVCTDSMTSSSSRSARPVTTWSACFLKNQKAIEARAMPPLVPIASGRKRCLRFDFAFFTGRSLSRHFFRSEVMHERDSRG